MEPTTDRVIFRGRSPVCLCELPGPCNRGSVVPNTACSNSDELDCDEVGTAPQLEDPGTGCGRASRNETCPDQT